MDRKIIILILVIFICLIAGAAAIVFTTNTVNNGIAQEQNTTQTDESNTSNTTVSGIQVLATQKGPSTAHKGDNITINYTIANTGSQTVYNVKALEQEFGVKTLGTLKAGESKNFQNTIHIPTDEEVREDFGPNATVSNPYYIGGFAVMYTDAKGSTYSLNANKLEIKLV
ncbi:MAG: hypothetical protein K8E24_001480 [Methanobacterium paludis]|nr:hypothetical protein [Methanobacterium paludis]